MRLNSFSFAVADGLNETSQIRFFNSLFIVEFYKQKQFLQANCEKMKTRQNENS